MISPLYGFAARRQFKKIARSWHGGGRIGFFYSVVSGEYMFSLAKKIALISLIAFCAYKAVGFYVFYTFANSVVAQCTSLEEMASLKQRKASGPAVERFMHTTFSCVKEKQNFIQAHYFPVPDKWINPPPGSVTYQNIPDF